MLSKRIIPCLDIKDGRTVKGVNFLNLRDAGDPVALAKQYAVQGFTASFSGPSSRGISALIHLSMSSGFLNGLFFGIVIRVRVEVLIFEIQSHRFCIFGIETF